MLTLIARTFPAPATFALTSLSARINQFGTKNPVRLYNADNVLMSKHGILPVGADGRIEAYVNGTSLVDIELFVTSTGFVVSTESGVDPAKMQTQAPTPATTAADIMALIADSAPLRAAIKGAAA